MKKLSFDKEKYKKSINENKLTLKVSLFFSHLVMWSYFFFASLIIGIVFSLVIKEMTISNIERVINPGELKYILPMMSIYFILYIITMITGKTGNDYFGLKKNYFKLRKNIVSIILLFSILAFFTKTKK